MAGLFECTRLPGHLSLSRQACAGNWLRARQAKTSDSRYACRGCPIGSWHAGRPDDPVHQPAAPANLCVRCHREHLRLVRHALCVSCYNRERELSLGRNRRGNYPARHVPLRQITLLYAVDRQHIETSTTRSSSVVEAVLRTAKRHEQRIVFGWHGGPVCA